MSGLNEWGLNHGIEIDVDANTEDQHIPVESQPENMPEADAHEIFKEVIPGDVPELKDDLNIIAQESARIQDLQYVLSDLKSLGGMNQSIAQEAQRLDPLFDGGRALGYYSKHTSATRYKPAMESIWTRIRETFKDLLKKLREMLRRFALWVVGSRDPKGDLMNKSNEQIVKEVEETARKQEYRTDEIQQDLEDLSRIAKLVEQAVS